MLGPAVGAAAVTTGVVRRLAIAAGLVLVIAVSCSRSAPADPVQIAQETVESLDITVIASASVLITESPEQSTPQIETLEISPNSVVVDPGDTIQFSAEAVDSDGQPLSEVELVWAMADVRAGTITRDGRFQAGTRPGAFDQSISVTGIHNTLEGIGYASSFASVEVVGDAQVPELASVVFIPDNPTLLRQQIARLRAVGFDDQGLVIPGVSFIWKLNDPTLGHINEIGYLTVKGDEGTYAAAVTVTGIWSGHRISAQTDVHVVRTGKAEDTLNVHALPQRFFLDPGDRLRLSAVALNGLGELVSGTELRWSMEDSRAGTIDGKGNFVAGSTPGVYTEAVKVEAVIPGERGFAQAADFASVVIREKASPGRLKAVSVAPETAVLAPGGRTSFLVQTVDDSGQPAADVTTSWVVLNDDIGEINPLGSFKAGSIPGRYAEALRVRVDQHYGDEVITFSRTVSVVVTGTLSRTEAQPALAVVAPGRTTHFSLTGWDENGVALPGLVVIWSVTDQNVGSIDAFGNFTAGSSPGMYQDAIRAKAIQRLSDGR